MKLAIWYGGLDNFQVTTNVLVENGISIIETGPEFFLNSDEKRIENTAKEFVARGIKINAVHAPFDNDYNLSNLDADRRKNAIEVHKDLIYKVSYAKVPIIVVHPGSNARSEEEIRKMNELSKDSLYQIIGTAEELNVKISLENMMPGCPGSQVKDIIEIIEEINSPFLGACFDTGHAHACGNIIEFLSTLKGKITNVHLNDNDGTWDMHLQPPYGTADWQGFIKTLREIEYEGVMTIEASPWGGASIRQMVREVSALFESILEPDEWQTNNPNIAIRCLNCGHYVFRSKGKWFCNCTYQ